MKTIMSPRFPPLPIEINYERQTAKGTSRMLAALKRPDRIRGITLTASTSEFAKFFKATKCPFPALESLTLCDWSNNNILQIPATFLKGSDLHLRTLKLETISLESEPISRILSPLPSPPGNKQT
jgi:hypothetical protein